MKKNGLSPVIATMLLIVIVITIGLVVFLWLKGIVGEKITKFGGENIELACEKVEFTADYSGGTVYIVNTGNVAIYKMNLKISKPGSHTTQELFSNNGLNPGGSFSDSISEYVSGATKITLIPILMGTVEGTKKSFTCDERHGQEISL